MLAETALVSRRACAHPDNTVHFIDHICVTARLDTIDGVIDALNVGIQFRIKRQLNAKTRNADIPVLKYSRKVVTVSGWRISQCCASA